MRALHIVLFEKFLPHIVEVSEAVNPGDNRYVALKVRGRTIYDVPPGVPCNLRPGSLKIDAGMRENADWCEVVFIHSFHRKLAGLLKILPPETVVVWCGFGADYYALSPRYRDRMLLPETLRVAYPLQSKLVPRLTRTFPALSTMLRRAMLHLAPLKTRTRKFDRVDFFSVLENDLGLEKTLPGFRARRIPNFGYYTFERVLGAAAGPVSGSDILIGNSATWSNNHLDLFSQLRDIHLDGRRIILPLSYGKAHCAEVVSAAAKRQFGEGNVIVLREWMPIEEYNRTIAGCGIVLMNHIRGQAMGNICSMLWRGARVVMRRENPYSLWLKSLGVELTDSPEGLLTEEELTPLGSEAAARNSTLMEEFWRFESVVARTAGLFEFLGQEAAARRASNQD